MTPIIAWLLSTFRAFTERPKNNILKHDPWVPLTKPLERDRHGKLRGHSFLFRKTTFLYRKTCQVFFDFSG